MSREQKLGIVSPVPKDDWSANVEYQELNIVRHGLKTYIAKKPSMNIEPNVHAEWKTYWMLLLQDLLSESYDLEEKTITLDLKAGDQIVEPSSGKLFSKIIILKPEGLIPENIVFGVTIAGVTGSYIESNSSYTEGLEYTLSSDGTYYSCSGIGTATSTEIIIKNSVNSIPVTSISDSAFSDNANITYIKIANTVTSIGNRSFWSCDNLKIVTMGVSVTSIGAYAFQNCSSLTSINLSDSIASMGESLFDGCSSLTNITIPDSVRSIGDNAFKNCIGAKIISIGAGLSALSTGFCYGCSSLTSITIPANIETIGVQAFDSCSNLVSAIISYGVKTIDIWAFQNCSSLTSIKLPDSVTSIGAQAFKNCNSLMSIYLPTNPPGLSNVNVFNGIAESCIFYCKTAASLASYQSATNWSSLASTYTFKVGE